MINEVQIEKNYEFFSQTCLCWKGMVKNMGFLRRGNYDFNTTRMVVDMAKSSIFDFKLQENVM